MQHHNRKALINKTFWLKWILSITTCGWWEFFRMIDVDIFTTHLFYPSAACVRIPVLSLRYLWSLMLLDSDHCSLLLTTFQPWTARTYGTACSWIQSWQNLWSIIMCVSVEWRHWTLWSYYSLYIWVSPDPDSPHDTNDAVITRR